MEETPPPAEAPQRIALFGKLTHDMIVIGGTLGLSYLGVAITYIHADLAYLYWFTLIPVFAAVCIAIEWFRVREQQIEIKWRSWVGKQLLHWGGLLIAVELVYSLFDAGRIPRTTSGLVILLLLALTTFLYGVHLDWRFIVVGLFLAISYLIMAYFVTYVWLLLLIAILIMAVAIFIAKRSVGAAWSR